MADERAAFQITIAVAPGSATARASTESAGAAYDGSATPVVILRMMSADAVAAALAGFLANRDLTSIKVERTGRLDG